MKRYFLLCIIALLGQVCAQAQEVTIGSKADWDAFAVRVNAGETSLNAIMTADILEGVTTMVGTENNPYGGTFNGNGHTLTLALSSSGQHCAPFSRVSGATIENLKTTGTVAPSGIRYHASGLVGNNDGGFTARNCWVAADVVSSDYSGGLLGHGSISPFTMENCLFSGSNNATTNVGGLVGWDDNSTPTITNCLNVGTFSYSGFAPIARVGGRGAITNCYYTTATSCSGDRADSRGTFTDKTGSELAELLGDGWVANGDLAVPTVFGISLTVPNLLLKPGNTASVGIGMNNKQQTLVSFQMDVYLPDGISVDKAGSSLTSRFSSGELTIGLQSDGSYRLTATSFSLSPITGTEGDLVNLSLTASANAEEGEASIRNILFVTSGSASIQPEDVTFNILDLMEQTLSLTGLPVMTYGDDEYTLPGETDQGQPIEWSVDNNAVAEIVGNNLVIKGAGTATVTAYQGGSNRYLELQQVFDLTVNKAPLTITANNYTITQGDDLPTYEVTYDGFKNNDTASALITQPSINCTATSSSTLGTYDIVASGAESDNYTITYVNGILTINEQAISFADPNVEALCVSNWDTNGSGTLSYEEAAAVTDLGQVFTGNSSITTFDELQYFTGLTSIGVSAFDQCLNLTSVILPDGITSINENAFRGCAISSIDIPDGVTYIGGDAFSNTPLYNSMADGAIYIGDCLYGYKGSIPNDTQIVIANGTLSISSHAFKDCTGITAVTIPSSVTSIGESAFEGCADLTAVIAEGGNPASIDASNAFSSLTNAKLYVPQGASSTYATANGWNDFTTIKEFPDGDINEDGETNVEDVVYIACYVVGQISGEVIRHLADVDNSNSVTIADAIVLVNDIAGDTNWAKPMMAMSRAAANDVLKLVSTDGNNLSLQMDGNGQYAAFQFDLWLPENIDVMDMTLNNERRQGHQLLYNKVGDGHYRVVALSTAANSFNGTSGELLDMILDGFATDDIRVDGIRFVNPYGSEKLFDALGVTHDGIATSVNGINVDGNSDTRTVYNLNGQRIHTPQKGVHVINGRKVVVK